MSHLTPNSDAELRRQQHQGRAADRTNRFTEGEAQTFAAALADLPGGAWCSLAMLMLQAACHLWYRLLDQRTYSSQHLQHVNLPASLLDSSASSLCWEQVGAQS